MSFSKIQGSSLELTVVCCSKLKVTTWLTDQDPFMVFDYAGTKYRTKVCKDGGKNPTFNEKFTIYLAEGMKEINVAVWNHNTMKSDVFIGSGRIQLQRVLAEGYDDSTWMLESNSAGFVGEVKLIMRHHPVAEDLETRRPRRPSPDRREFGPPPPLPPYYYPPPYVYGPYPPGYPQYPPPPPPPPMYPPTPPHHRHHFPYPHPHHYHHSESRYQDDYY